MVQERTLADSTLAKSLDSRICAAANAGDSSLFTNIEIHG